MLIIFLNNLFLSIRVIDKGYYYVEIVIRRYEIYGEF